VSPWVDRPIFSRISDVPFDPSSLIPVLVGGWMFRLSVRTSHRAVPSSSEGVRFRSRYLNSPKEFMSQPDILGTDDFDRLSWHDNHVHALLIEERANGLGELVLDIDHIVEWVPPREGTHLFRVAPAFLRFQGVSDLRISLDYAAVSAAMTPFSIHDIRRERIDHPNGYSTDAWEIDVNWPPGQITFNATGFTQELRGAVIETQEQYLSPEERRAALQTNTPKEAPSRERSQGEHEGARDDAKS